MCVPPAESRTFGVTCATPNRLTLMIFIWKFIGTTVIISLVLLSTMKLVATSGSHATRPSRSSPVTAVRSRSTLRIVEGEPKSFNAM